MASSVSATGSSRSSSLGSTSSSGTSAIAPTSGSLGGASTSGGAMPGRERGVGPRDPQERQYVHWEGRQFDMDAPRGTYVNILV